MAAAVFNLTSDYAIAQGGTWTVALVVYRSTGVVWDLSTGPTTVAAKIRRKFSDSAAVQAITCTITDAPNGAISMSLTAVETAALTISTTAQNPDTRRVSLGVYDVELTEAAVVTRILEGTVELSQEATK